MLQIFHAPQTRGTRAIWLCEELELPYEIVKVDFSPQYRASAEWRAINPVGKVPAMRDGDLTMFESGAMMQTILDRYGAGRLRPEPGSNDHALYLQWMWFGESTFSRPMGEVVNHRRVFGEDKAIPAVVEEMRGRVRLAMDAVEQAMAGRAFIVGDDFTAADIMVGGTAINALRLIDADGYPNLVAYRERLAARPAYRRGQAAETA